MKAQPREGALAIAGGDVRIISYSSLPAPVSGV